MHDTLFFIHKKLRDRSRHQSDVWAIGEQITKQTETTYDEFESSRASEKNLLSSYVIYVD